MVGWYSAMTAPAASKEPHVARDALLTVSLSVCSPGTTIRNWTPRFNASSRVRVVNSSGTNYDADKSIERAAAVIANRYISLILSLPPLGELLNICA